MPNASFGQARRFAGSPGEIAPLALSALLVSSLTVALLLTLGLILQILAPTGAADGVSSDPVAWLNEAVLVRQFGERPDKRLFVVIVAGLALSAGLAGGRVILVRESRRLALQKSLAIKQALHDQAHRLGTGDWLGTHQTRPELLFGERAAELRAGFERWWSSIPGDAVAVLCLVGLASVIHLWLTLLALLLAVFLRRQQVYLRQQAEQAATKWSERSALAHEELTDSIHQAFLVAGYGLARAPGDPFADKLRRYETVARHEASAGTLQRPALLLAVLGMAAFLLLIVGFNVLSQPPSMSVAGSVVLGAALLCAFAPAARLYDLPDSLSSPDKAAHEILLYLERQPSVTETAPAVPLERLKRELTCEHVTWADQAGRRLLNDVSFSIAAGKKAAVISSDGPTPPALAALLVRFHDPASGLVRYDGRDLREATLATLRGRILLATADGLLFNGSVSENIACGESGFTSVQITEVARAVEAYDFIQALPQGFSTSIGDRGSRLRPHEAFRIGLARALLRDPSVLIVEEPKETGDAKVAQQLDLALQRAAQGRTCVTLATRLATLRSADRIFLFHEGKLAADGTHADLLQASDLYRHINYVRFNAYRGRVQ